MFSISVKKSKSLNYYLILLDYIFLENQIFHNLLHIMYIENNLRMMLPSFHNHNVSLDEIAIVFSEHNILACYFNTHKYFCSYHNQFFRVRLDMAPKLHISIEYTTKLVVHHPFLFFRKILQLFVNVPLFLGNKCSRNHCFL